MTGKFRSIISSLWFGTNYYGILLDPMLNNNHKQIREPNMTKIQAAEIKLMNKKK